MRMFAADSIFPERRNSAGKSSVTICIYIYIYIYIYDTAGPRRRYYLWYNRIRRARGFIAASHALVITQPRINFVKLYCLDKKKR